MVSRKIAMRNGLLLCGVLFAQASQPHATPAAPFAIAWNSPWPSACAANASTDDALTRWGVTTNAANAFNGAAVTTLYNSPGRMTLGLWPCYRANGSAVNGGLPQLANLSAHLAKVRADAAAALPDPAFSGYAVIDWEVWTPWLPEMVVGTLPPPAARSLYFNASLRLAGGDVAAAAAAWNASSLALMAATLRAAREVRPRAKWGYFGLVQCTFDVGAQACRPEFQRINDALGPLWAASDVLYPELYATCPFARGTAGSGGGGDDGDGDGDGAGAAGSGDVRCAASAKVPLKIEARLAEANRVARAAAASPGADGRRPPLGIVPFAWYDLDDGVCTSSTPGQPVGHCPLMRDAADLRAEFGTAREAGAEALVVWGSSGDVRNASLCAAMSEYVSRTLGPVMAAELRGTTTGMTTGLMTGLPPALNVTLPGSIN